MSQTSTTQHLPSISEEYICAKLLSSLADVMRSGDTSSQLTTCLTGVDVNSCEGDCEWCAGDSAAVWSMIKDWWSLTVLSSPSLSHYHTELSTTSIYRATGRATLLHM